MAITNAQQYQQLVNKPADGKRPGYRGDAAYRSYSAQSTGSQRGAATKSELGDGKPSGSRLRDDPNTRQDSRDDEIFKKRRELKKEVQRQEEEKAEEKVERFRNKQFTGLPFPSVTSLLNPLFKKGMTVNRNFFLDKVLGAGRLNYQGKTLTPEQFANLSLSEQEAAYKDYMSGRLSGETDAYGNPLMRGDDGPDPIPFVPLVENNTEEDTTTTPVRNLGGLTARIGGGLYNFDTFAADGGRIGFQEGGIMPRLNQLGSGVSSAEQMLQGINQRLQSAESTLGGGSGFTQPAEAGSLVPGIAGYESRKETGMGQPKQLPSIIDDNRFRDPVTGGGQPFFMGNMFRGGDQVDRLTPLNQLNVTPPQTPVAMQSPLQQAMGFADGGIANLDREAFLLGGIAKGLKKAVRGVKKIAKSKIGKAALLGALGYGLGGGTFFGKMLPGVTRGGQGFGGFGGLSSIFGNVGDIIGGTSLGDKFAKFAGNKIGMGILSASVLPLIFGKKPKDDFDLDAYYAANRLDPNAPLNKRIAGSEFDFYGGQTAADGGRIGYQEGGDAEPVAKKTMPLLDMDGKEKDYRETGGFVDMGRMERADDVPARLSKNEFVFTADAVRNAGEGDIDKGAEVMYNMMKNLEAGGEVSEESQGLEGARKMFQTSQRLGEVI